MMTFGAVMMNIWSGPWVWFLMMKSTSGPIQDEQPAHYPVARRDRAVRVW